MAGHKIGEYVLGGLVWPHNTESSYGYFPAPLATGMYYEEASNLLWATYEQGFGLAAYNPLSKRVTFLLCCENWPALPFTIELQNNTWPAWEAVYYDQYYVYNQGLDLAENLIVDTARDVVIITTNDPENSVYWLNRTSTLPNSLIPFLIFSPSKLSILERRISLFFVPNL